MSPETVSRWDRLTLVADGDGFVVGDPRVGTYVAIPPIGARVLRWLQEGSTLTEVAARAAEEAGEPVDVDGFVTALEDQGVLPRADVQTLDRRPRLALRRIGALLFGRSGWLGLCSLSMAGVVVLASQARLRPRSADLVVSDSPLVSILLGSALALLCVVAHELAHALAAAARGVPTRLSVGRRLYFVTAQADLTGLWSLPRRRRFGPLLAGLAVDGASAGAVLLAEACRIVPDGSLPVTRYVVAIQLASLVLQGAVFMRTDLYAVVLVASGSRNLWAVKDALIRGLLRRRRPEDLELLAATSERERRVAGWYLLLYVPGLGLAAWYLAAVALPALGRLLLLTVDGFRPLDLGDVRTWESVAVVVLVLGPNAFALTAALTSGLRRSLREGRTTTASSGA